MLKVLYDLCSSKKDASFYSNPEKMNRFDYGTVFAVNDKEIALHLITPDGKDDGITVTAVENIFRVETDGLYSEKMNKLCTDTVRTQYNIDIKENNILKSVLSYAKETGELVSLELLESGDYDVVGFVKEIEEDQCTVMYVDEYGFEDGLTYFSVGDISELEFASEDERRIMKLWKFNKKK